MGEKVALRESEGGRFDDGWYQMQVGGAKLIAGKYGQQLEIEFIIHSPTGEKGTRRGWFTPARRPDSKLGQLCGALGISLDGVSEFDTDLVAGKWIMGRLLTAPNQSGKPVQRVAQFAPGAAPAEAQAR